MTPEAFIRKMSHDIRAPLRGLKELPTWLEEDLSKHLEPVPETVRELLELMNVQARRLDSMVLGLSELANLARTENQPRAEVLAVFADVSWPDSLRRNFDVDFLPLEPDHAKLVVKHLVDNAFKHANAAANPAELTVSTVVGGVRIAVSDAGPGIDPAYFAKVYEPLATLKSRDACEGSGIGLAVVARIAELYGGTRGVIVNSDGPGITSEIVIPTG